VYFLCIPIDLLSFLQDGLCFLEALYPEKRGQFVLPWIQTMVHRARQCEVRICAFFIIRLQELQISVNQCVLPKITSFITNDKWNIVAIIMEQLLFHYELPLSLTRNTAKKEEILIFIKFLFLFVFVFLYLSVFYSCLVCLTYSKKDKTPRVV
jgi:hypothetical protein